ncbi:translocation/assembly module TamB domain-containing protein [Mastigocladopsis repens]|uniref:translocation/assembly module TamB domain-containing protein n=1 Tax=Mastigocladopsis repens TaxID=221287 RepID=UPI000319174B|nr:translocation/assembly module TamB [Mastigocladopsis repens]
MTRPPNSGNEQEPIFRRRLWLLLLGRTSLVLGVILLAGIAGGYWWARNYIYKELAPLVQSNLQQLLGREVKLGAVERFSLSSLRFGSLSVPATPTDRDRVAAKAVEVEFSPLRLIFNRTLALNVTLVQPNVYIDQDKQGRWVTTELKQGEGQGFIQTELQTLQIQNGDVVLDPNPTPNKPKGSVTLDQVNGIARFPQQAISYELNAQPTKGGSVKIDGKTQLNAQQTTNLKVQAQNLQASDVSRLIELPIALQAGQVNGDLTVQLPLNQQQSNNQQNIAITGTAVANQVTAQIQNVPQKFINSNGRLVFQGQTIALDNLSTNYGKVPVLASGTLNTQKGYNISAQVKAASAKNVIDTLNFNLPVPVAGDVQAKIQLQGAIQQPVLSGTASNITPVQVDRVLFQNINTDFRLNVSEAASQVTVSNLRLIPAAGGQITGNGQIKLGAKPQQGGVIFNLQAEGVSGDVLAGSYSFTPPTSLGNVSAKAEISGTLDKPLLSLSGETTPPAGGKITANGQIQLANNGRVALDVQALGLPGNAIAQGYGFSTPINIGGVSANAKISGSLGTQPLEVAVSSIKATPEVGGQITANGQLQLAPQGRISFNVQAQNLPGDAIAKAYNTSPTITVGNVSANAKISGSLGNLQTVAQLSAPQATYPTTGQVVVNQQGNSILFQDGLFKVAGGTITGRGQVVQGRWQAFVDAEQIQLSRFAQIPPQLQGGVLSSELNLSGTTASFQPSTIQASGQANLRSVAGGTVNLRNINLNAGRWQAVADVAQVQLNRFSEQLQGRLGSNLQIAGTTESFNLANIRAAGQVRLSQLALLAQPLTAQVQWNGQQVIIQRATTPGLSANGVVAVQIPETGTPQVSAFNLNVQARDYNLQKASSTLPGNVALAGQLDFTGQVTGTPTAPNATGNIRLENFKVNTLAFDPVLAGNVNYQGGQGGQLQLAGTQDRIAVNVNANNRPTSFLVRRDGTVATGRTEGENLLVNVQDFPVAVLEGFIPGNALQPLAGQISGNLVVNLDTYAVAGDVAVAQPRIGRVTADEFRGNISYTDGTASLTNGELRIGQSRISLSGNLQPGNDPQFQAQANFDKTRIETVLQAFNIFDFQDVGGGLQTPDFAGAEVLQTKPISLPDANLLTQLEYFSKIQDLIANRQEQRDEPTTVPTLAELQGAVSGAIEVSGSLQSGLNASFNVQGDDWQWGEYSIDQVIARGTFADGVVTLLPLSVDLNPGLLAFTGQLGTEQLSGQLRLANLPVSLLQPFLERLPVDVTGQVNAVATLGGDLKDPTAIGELTIVDATINKQPVQTGELSFNYNNARLNFDSTVLVTGTEPVKVTGSVPAPLPFASVQPDSNQISISANVQNEGLALLNLFNNQVTWVNGQGQVDVDIQGTLNQPIITGNASVQNATFQAQALSDPLTNVTGTLQFNGNRVTVESIQGQYNQGNVTAAGVLPIFASQAAQQLAATNPLTVSVNNLDVNLQGLYQGGVSGDVIIGGTALSPDIGGVIQLSDGQVAIGQQSTTASAQPTDTQQGSATDNPTTTFSAQPTETGGGSATAGAIPANLPIEFDGLRLILGDDVNVTTQPILGFVPGGNLSPSLLSFEAKGNLTINGTLAKPRPQGVIRLTGGQVNLFTTQFTLERGFEQTARFTPSRGLDPVLDVRLVATVPEATGTGSRTLNSPFSSEINDVSAINFGTLRTVRVIARAKGPASQLTDNLELTSEPGRREAEIISLLGGSIINSLGQTDTTTGLVTLAGSTIFGNLQGSITAIGQAIGFSEFRIYPSTISNQASRASVLGLTAEGIFDISRNFSVSLSRVFLTNEPFRYNLIYRLNDETLVRGSTNLADESRLVVEYETRF